MGRVRVGIVGIGKIARDQHIPCLRESPDFELVACASRNAQVEGVENFRDLGAMLEARPDLEAVAICTPPQAHYDAAALALQRNKHVLLEKPPCRTVRELDELAALATRVGKTLYQTWHSRHAAAVEAARAWLAARRTLSARVTWKENVRQWHPGQTWIWEAGGFGVFDPGINALSILTAILPQAVFVRRARLSVPTNCNAPIAAEIGLATEDGAPIEAAFDFLQTGLQTWDIEVRTESGVVLLSMGGAEMKIDGRPVDVSGAAVEYVGVYRRFAELIAARQSDVDSRPFQLVADAFLIAEFEKADPFVE